MTGVVVLTRLRRLLLLTGCVTLGVLGLGSVEANAATPSSLAGEALTSRDVTGSQLTGGCPLTDGQEASFSFSVSGTATGPFPGTFTESGSFSAPGSGIVDTFSSTFTIKSPSGTVTVTGSKQLVEGTGAAVLCMGPFSGNDFLINLLNLPTTYTATIDGTQQTTGPAAVTTEGSIGPSGPLGPPFFLEIFGSGGVGGPPPTGKAVCKHGGWKSFPQFKNQGDCISFFATGGKNPPRES